MRKQIKGLTKEVSGQWKGSRCGSCAACIGDTVWMVQGAGPYCGEQCAEDSCDGSGPSKEELVHLFGDMSMK